MKRIDDKDAAEMLWGAAAKIRAAVGGARPPDELTDVVEGALAGFVVMQGLPPTRSFILAAMRLSDPAILYAQGKAIIAEAVAIHNYLV